VDGVEELWLTLLALGAIAGAGGLVCAALWWLLPRGRRRLLAPQRVRAVPWSGLDVWFAFGVQGLTPWALLGLLEATGFVRALYGQHVSPDDSRSTLWTAVLATPLQIVIILAELRWRCHARAYQLGLTTKNAVPNAIAGYLAWLVLTPLVLLLYALVSQWTTPEEHPLLRVAKENPHLVDWFLVISSAVVAAPIFEEFLFRGVLLPWLTRAPAVGHFMVAWAAVVAASVFSSTKGNELWLPASVLFIGALLPGYWLAPPLLRWMFSVPRRNAPLYGGPGEAVSIRLLPDHFAIVTRAIYGTSLLFAAFHSRVWPSPLPLFFLALGLGWLAYRTQSLVGPFVFHGLFNAVSCVALVLGSWSV